MALPIADLWRAALSVPLDEPLQPAQGKAENPPGDPLAVVVEPEVVHQAEQQLRMEQEPSAALRASLRSNHSQAERALDNRLGPIEHAFLAADREECVVGSLVAAAFRHPESEQPQQLVCYLDRRRHRRA